MRTANLSYVAETRTEGRKEGHTKAIVDILEDRAIATEKADRERILACADTDMQRTWPRAALTISRISDLFANQPS
jgi:hypothetical protein